MHLRPINGLMPAMRIMWLFETDHDAQVGM
jgi:hypothetical protein